MGWSKKNFVEQALAEIGIAGYIFDIQPEQYQLAAVRLDAMVMGWEANGLHIGWPMSSGPDTIDLNADTNCPTFAIRAIIKCLAMELAPLFGKQVSMELMGQARDAELDVYQQASARPMPRQLPSTMPMGAGRKPWRNINGPFMPTPTDPIECGGDGPIEFD